MFWISYSVTFVLASVVAIVMMAIRLVLSVVERALGSIPSVNSGTAASHCGITSERSHRSSRRS